MADPTVALPLLLVHVPLGVASVRAVVDPTHTFAVPVIAAGSGFTVIVAETLQLGPDM